MIFDMNRFDCVVVQKKFRCINKTKTKDGLQMYKKESLPGNIVTLKLEDLVMNIVFFLNHFVFLKLYL